jgi:hypothetical protein
VLQDHSKDAELLNKPIQHYEELETLFGGGMATGRYAMGYGEVLGVFSGFGDSVDKKLVIHIRVTHSSLLIWHPRSSRWTSRWSRRQW